MANFVTSLYFNVRARQAKSEVYEGAPGKCVEVFTNILCTLMWADELNVFTVAFIVRAKLNKL
jgi:hypothetical protein